MTRQRDDAGAQRPADEATRRGDETTKQRGDEATRQRGDEVMRRQGDVAMLALKDQPTRRRGEKTTRSICTVVEFALDLLLFSTVHLDSLALFVVTGPFGGEVASETDKNTENTQKQPNRRKASVLQRVMLKSHGAAVEKLEKIRQKRAPSAAQAR
ncbi:hypothetical protein MHYP_G00119850 [Metynnis hypsauchen]